ncbi:hypothetical protein LguiB_034481 [Lonicera macranthoides]
MDRRFDGAVVPPESTNGGTTARSSPRQLQLNYTCRKVQKLYIKGSVVNLIKVKGRNNGFIPDDIDMAVGSEKFMIKLETISRLDFNKRRARSISKAHEEFDWCYIDLDGEGDHSKLEEEDKKWGEDQPCHN